MERFSMNPLVPMFPLFVVIDGTLSISRGGEDDNILAVREPGQFTGEMSVISGSRSLLTARVTKDGALLELTHEKVLSLMAKDTELGDILMGAFVARFGVRCRATRTMGHPKGPAGCSVPFKTSRN
jgi:thioredoxin reductase (NADPH)